MSAGVLLSVLPPSRPPLPLFLSRSLSHSGVMGIRRETWGHQVGLLVLTVTTTTTAATQRRHVQSAAGNRTVSADWQRGGLEKTDRWNCRHLNCFKTTLTNKCVHSVPNTGCYLLAKYWFIPPAPHFPTHRFFHFLISWVWWKKQTKKKHHALTRLI